MDSDLQEIYDAANLEVDLNHKVGKNHQYLIEEAITNIAALSALNGSTEQILGNSQ